MFLLATLWYIFESFKVNALLFCWGFFMITQFWNWPCCFLALVSLLDNCPICFCSLTVFLLFLFAANLSAVSSANLTFSALMRMFSRLFEKDASTFLSYLWPNFSTRMLVKSSMIFVPSLNGKWRFSFVDFFFLVRIEIWENLPANKWDYL